MKKIVAAIFSACAVTAQGAEIKLKIEGCVPGEQVQVALYASAEGFAGDRDGRYALRKQALKAQDDTLYLSFDDLAPGKYAVAAFVDSNGNHTLDRNWVGKPTERYGFSRDARNLFGPPGFEQAAFEVGVNSTLQTLHLK